jgi:hypothetical protein
LKFSIVFTPMVTVHHTRMDATGASFCRHP